MEFEVQFGTLTEYRGGEEYIEIPTESPGICNCECGFVRLHDPRVVNVIGECAFMGNQKLKGVIVPDSVQRIGDMAFLDCVRLSEVKLGKGVRSIGKAAFSGCESLKNITIPESVEKIGKNAFRWIPDLTIRGKKGSEAERYALENGFEFIERAPKKTYVISDLHGYPFEKFLEILKKAEFSDGDTLYILGDVVDRGKDGVKYLLWLLEQKNVKLILGNHEKMMLNNPAVFDRFSMNYLLNPTCEQRINLGIWKANGAEPTIKGLMEIEYEQRQAIYEYVSQAPTYLEITVNGKNYILVHSGLRDFHPCKELSEYSENDLLWNRPELTERYFDDKTVIFGHTPTWAYGEEYEGKIIFTDTWIDIDAGAGAGLPPVLLRLEDMKQFTLEKPN